MAAPRCFSDAQHPYSLVRAAGDLVFVSGQLGVADGEIVSGGIAAETRQAFTNLAAALAAAGLGLSSIVKITVYLASMADRLVMDDVYIGILFRATPRPHLLRRPRSAVRCPGRARRDRPPGRLMRLASSPPAPHPLHSRDLGLEDILITHGTGP